MKLRSLRPEDAMLMLEWMHDPSVVKDMQTDFSRKTIDDCLAFISIANNTGGDIHLAITDDDDDTYLGTVSLKHIENRQAEFAIAVRTCAMGKGLAAQAMRCILEYGLRKLKLNRIYWCVSPDNTRAVRFYDKNGYRRIIAPAVSAYSMEQKAVYLWYAFEYSDLSD